MNSWPMFSSRPKNSQQIGTYLAFRATRCQKIRMFGVKLKGFDGATMLGGSRDQSITRKDQSVPVPDIVLRLWWIKHT